MSIGSFSTYFLDLLGELAKAATFSGLHILLGVACLGVVIGVIFYLIGGR